MPHHLKASAAGCEGWGAGCLGEEQKPQASVSIQREHTLTLATNVDTRTFNFLMYKQVFAASPVFLLRA